MDTASTTRGIYRHYKGNEYEFIGEALDSESGERLAIYRTVHEPYITWVRPYDMFFETVTIDGVEKPRFERIDT